MAATGSCPYTMPVLAQPFTARSPPTLLPLSDEEGGMGPHIPALNPVDQGTGRIRSASAQVAIYYLPNGEVVLLIMTLRK